MKRLAAVGRVVLVAGLAALAVGWTVLMGVGVDAPAPQPAAHTQDPAALGAGAHVTWVDESAFPAVTVYMAVNDAAGSPVYGLGQGDFTLEEDGKPVHITGFTGAGGGSSSTMLVLDHSASMDDENKIEGAVAAAKTYVDMLAAGYDSAGLIGFDAGVYALVPLDVIDDAQRALLKDRLDSIGLGSGTAFYDAVQQGIEAVAGISGRKVVLALTDGQDNQSRMTSLNGVIGQAADAGVPVYTVGLGSDLDRGGLQALADGTGGQAYFSPGAAELAALYASIAEGLRNEYALTYTTLVPNQDGTRRALDVVVGGAAGGQSASSSYGVGGILAPSLDWWVFLPTLLVLLVGLVALERAPGAVKGLRKRRAERAARQAETPAPPAAAAPWPSPPGPQAAPLPVQPPPPSPQPSPPIPAAGPALVWVLPLPPGGGSVGSAPNSAAVLAEAGIAPLHFQIAPADGRYVLTDLAGGGATCVSFGGDPAKLRPPAGSNALKDGSLIQAGGALLTFRQGGAGAWLERRYPLGPGGLCAGSTPACAVRLPAAAPHEALVTWDGARWVAEARAGSVLVSYGGDPAQLRPPAGRNALKSGSLVQVGGALLRLDC